VALVCFGNGEVYSAGTGLNGELMRTTIAPSYVATDFPVSVACKSVFTTTGASMVLGRDGTVWSAGLPGPTGRNVSADSPIQIRFSPPTFVRDLFVGQYNPDSGATASMAVGRSYPLNTFP
jgi:alpha-tubulin suppressor-like RCC1 family protein